MFYITDTTIQLLSVLVAIVSAVISVAFSLRARRDIKLQHQVQLVALKGQYYSELQRWADAVVDAMTEAIYLCDSSPTANEIDKSATRIRTARQTLSSLIDRGRFFLPNEERDAVGQDKPSAYRGFRQPALSYIVAAYEVLERTDTLPNQSSFSRLWSLRKHFVSAIQVILDPEEREKELRQLLASVE
ncbi:MAG: hypothetical protein K1X65_06045 [Caldilineales bacterium]|nr:hypothetical protein [Caldilineales bacterium]